MSGRPGDQPRGRYRHGVVRWVAAGAIVLALVAAVLPSFGADPGDGRDDTGTAEIAATPAPTEVTGIVDAPSSSGAAPDTGSTAPTQGSTSQDTSSSDTSEPSTDGTVPDLPSLYGLLADDPQFSSVENAIDAAGLFDDLENGGPFTLFAPSNDAFEALDPAFAGALNADPELLEAVLFHHALDGSLERTDLREGPIEMVDGSTVDVEIGPDGITLTSGDTSAQVVDADLAASNGVLHVIDGILVPAEIDADVVADTAVAVSVARGIVTLAGSVADEVQRELLVAAVEESVDPRNVDDTLVVDPAAAAYDARLDDLATVSARLPVELVSGDARLAGEAIAVSGVIVDDGSRRRLEAVADDTGTDVLFDLERRSTADAVAAGTIAAEVGALLAEHPLTFTSGVTFADPAVDATLDRLAGLVKSADGLDIAVVGFTDTAGNAASNLQTSLLRAAEVEDELVRRGVPAEDLTAAGFGETMPVLVDGVEDAAASRRVEVAVRLAEPEP